MTKLYIENICIGEIDYGLGGWEYCNVGTYFYEQDKDFEVFLSKFECFGSDDIYALFYSPSASLTYVLDTFDKKTMDCIRENIKLKEYHYEGINFETYETDRKTMYES